MDLYDDALGPSAFIHGSELRPWDHLVDHLDLVDNFLCVGNKEGPYFTRQAKKTDHYDQLRLDRYYTSKRNEWCKFVKEIIHEGKQTLYDHIPVTYTFILKEERESRRKRSSYFKMDTNLVNIDEIEEGIEKLWEEHQILGRDPKINWDLAWARIKRVMQKEKRKQAEIKNKCEKAEELQRRRIVVETDHNIVAAKALGRAKIEARKLDMMEIIRLRLKSREKWLTWGDAPMKYFFY